MEPSVPYIEIRSVARLVVLDGARKVLLFRHDDGRGRPFWATPGGALEPGETAADAAHREALEELGTDDVELELIWTGHRDFEFDGRRVSQDENYFFVRRHGRLFEVDVDPVLRRERVTDIGWWSLDEIAGAEELVYPLDLALRLRDVLAEKG